jgi:hypothetical protein
LYDGRALPVLAEAKKLGGGKAGALMSSTRTTISTMPAACAPPVAEGATLVTSEMARPYFERTFATPNSINPDALQRVRPQGQCHRCQQQTQLHRWRRVIVDVYYIEGSVHAQGFMMVHLPREKILIQADAFTPGPPNTAPPARANDLHVNLVQNVERLGLQVDRILPLHGRVVPVAELYTAIGRKN